MRTPVILPELGAEPVLFSLWFAEPGDPVFKGDRLAEVLADGASFDVHAPASGRLVERCVWPRDRLKPGQVLGLVEVDPEDRGAGGPPDLHAG
jgi:pyruvate/2-oxoglutarate dehydrogenase complex dihydrolipoamide acyltransferase (E2) component